MERGDKWVSSGSRIKILEVFPSGGALVLRAYWHPNMIPHWSDSLEYIAKRDFDMWADGTGAVLEADDGADDRPDR